MPRPKGSKNTATMAREAAERAAVIAEYEASRKKEDDVSPPAVDPGPFLVAAQEPQVVNKEPAEEELDLGPVEEEELDLDPPPKPVKAAPRVPLPRPPARPIDRNNRREVNSGRVVGGLKAKRPLEPGPKVANWRLGSRSA